MKRQMKYALSFWALLGTALLCFSSCSDTEEDFVIQEKPSADKELHTCVLKFNAVSPQFDQNSGKRTAATSSEWADGSKVYLHFLTSGNPISGTATYSKSADSWQLAYYGNLSETTEGNCGAYYFEGIKSENNTLVEFTPFTKLFEDVTAQYQYDGQTVSLIATLQPATGRVRLKGQEKDTAVLYGIRYIASYDFTNNTFAAGYDDILLTTTPELSGDEGIDQVRYYTPYIYGFFQAEDVQTLTLVSKSEGYSCKIKSELYAPGKSGVLDFPHSDNHVGWTAINPFMGVQFPDSISEERIGIIRNLLNEMVHLDGGTFTMGYGTGTDNYSPAHPVYVNPFYISKYEITEEQWEAVMNYPAPNSLGSKYPVRVQRDFNGYDELCENDGFEGHETEAVPTLYAFVEKLRLLTGFRVRFDIPYESEWEYAARKGKAQSGSYYAWLGGSTSSKPKEVGSLYPDDNGLYDIIGNVSELCRYIGKYPAGLQVNPWDAEFEDCAYCKRGASCTDVSNNMYTSVYNRTSSKFDSGYTTKDLGLRLVIRYY